MNLQYLRVDFDLALDFARLSAFRGAIAHKVGEKHTLFHHHFREENGESKFLYRYPLIQYKRLYGKAAIVCLGKAVSEIHHLFEQADWTIQLGKEEIALKIARLNLHQFDLQLHAEAPLYTYSIQNWLALNSENYARYQSATGLRNRIGILEGILASNLISFAGGIDWQVPERFELLIEEVEEAYVMPYKGTPLTAFSLTFKTNLFLPSYIGLGKGVSRGFGMIKFLPNKNPKPKNHL